MLARLERSAERERAFVASASHELRTPLALLRAELELALREGRSPEELREAVASAAAESDRLVQLAEDLLVLARADEGRLPVRPEQLDAGELLATTARRFEARAAESGRELRVEGSNGLTVHADRMRAEQALANLVDNALRHGDGAVELMRRAGRRRRAPARARPRPRLRPGSRRPRLRALHARRPRTLARRHGARAGHRRRDRALARARAPAPRDARAAAPTPGSTYPALTAISFGQTRTDAMNIHRKYIAVGGAVLALSAAGVGVAVAGGESGDAKEQVSGPGADKARAAALADHPGTANAVERDSENGATWEVEITGNDGKTVDVRLDQNYKVVAIEGDREDAGGRIAQPP